MKVRRLLCAIVLALATTVPEVWSQKAGPRGTSQFPAGGIRVPVPGHPECEVTVEAWENGSYWVLKGEKPPLWTSYFMNRPIKPGKRNESIDGRSAERRIADILALTLKYSPDMVNKVVKACELKGSIAIRVVRDDESVRLAHALRESNVILIDIGDFEKTVPQPQIEHRPGVSDEARYDAAQQASRAFELGLLPHEIDHLLETGTGEHLDPPNAARLPNGEVDTQGGAVRDENQVLSELKIPLQRPAYFVGYNNRPAILYANQNTMAFFDPPKAIALANARTARGTRTQSDFFPEDMVALDAIDDHCCGCGGVPCPPVSHTSATSQPSPSPQQTPAPQPPPLPETLGNPSGADWQEAVLPFAMHFVFPLIGFYDRDDEPAIPPPVSAPQTVPSVTNASASTTGQKMGGSALSYVEHHVVVSEAVPVVPLEHRLAGLLRGLVRLDAANTPRLRAHSNGTAHLTVRSHQSSQRTRPRSSTAKPPTVTAIFTSLGRSSGDAFRMDVVHDAPGAIAALASGFVLEPVDKVRAQDVQRDLARLKGKRGSATIVAYCLEFLKAPPAADTIYRLVPPERAKQFGKFPQIMVASKKLLDAGSLHPDSDPKEYFDSIRQWSVWTVEQGWKTEDAFGKAFVSHAQKNYAAAARPWSPQVETGIKRIVPGRWRDIQAVLREADRLTNVQ